MTKVFLRDFITKDKLKWYGIAFILFGAFLYYFPLPQLPMERTAGVLGIMVCFFPTMYTIYTYTAADNIRLYLTLPVKPQGVIFSFVLSLFIVTLIERIAFVALAIVFLLEYPIPVIVFLLFSGAATVLINVAVLLGANTKQLGVCFAGAVLLAGLVLTCAMVSGLTLQLALALLVGLLAALLLRRHDSLDLAIFRQSKQDKSHLANYFFRVLLTEKIYLTNTFMVVLFAVAFLFMFAEPGNPAMMSVAWCIAAVNTPATTMISGDKWLARQSDMLPDCYKSICGMYRRFLAIYFSTVNIIVLAACFIRSGQFVPYIPIQFAAATLLEVHITVYLEKHRRITGWQTKQQLWRNLRKYILPVIVFIVVCGIPMIMI